MIFPHRIISFLFFLNIVQLFNNFPKVKNFFFFVFLSSKVLLILILDEDMCNTTKLCYLILLCITEDEFANATMHDENVIFSVYLHKAVGIDFYFLQLIKSF